MLGIIVVTTSTHGEQLYVEGWSRRISLSNVLIPKAVHLSAHTHSEGENLEWDLSAMELLQNLEAEWGGWTRAGGGDVEDVGSTETVSNTNVLTFCVPHLCFILLPDFWSCVGVK